jgi:hypothetical protein
MYIHKTFAIVFHPVMSLRVVSTDGYLDDHGEEVKICTTTTLIHNIRTRTESISTTLVLVQM